MMSTNRTILCNGTFPVISKYKRLITPKDASAAQPRMTSISRTIATTCAAAPIPELLCVDGAGVDGHSGDGVHAHGVEFVNLAALLDAARDDELLGGAGAQDRGDVDGEAGHGALGVDVGVEE